MATRSCSHRRSVWFARGLLIVVGACLLTWLAPVEAQAQPAARPLGCSLKEGSATLPSAKLCDALGRALQRPVQLIEDARKAQGEAVELLRDDVQWTVVVLAKGSVRAWTRVSIGDAQNREADVFARILRVLLRTKPKQTEACVRVVPQNERSKRAPDVIYPWAELKPCTLRSVEVLDPWWK